MHISGTKIAKLSVAATLAISPLLLAVSPALASCTVTIRNTTSSDDRYTDTAHQIRYEINWNCAGGGQSEMTSKVSSSNAMIDRVGDVSPSMSGWAAPGSGAGFGAGGLTSQLLPQTTYFVQGYVVASGVTYSSEIIGITTTSEEVAARNTTTTTVPNASNPTVAAETPPVSGTSSSRITSVTSVIDAIEDDGLEDDFAELTVRMTDGKFDLRVNSSYPETDMVIRARKPGVRVIVWNFTTTSDGARRILTSRNLSGYTLSLLVDDEVFHRVRVR
jgi:hypothetical protein